jgi:hypothetical protein
MSVEKDYIIQTEVMSQGRLNEYGFQQLDTRTASDHFPKVTDFNLDPITNVNAVAELNDFKLEQNYPNPFNPATNIEFRISEHGFVSLKVYDILSNEIATLVNEELAAGEYVSEFNVGKSASGGIPVLPSGIYFYQLRIYPANGGTESYVDTKKMIFLK